MRKITVICLTLISTLILGTILAENSYAVLSCKVGLQTPQSTYTEGDEISVTVNISNLQAGKGIVALGAVVDYDKTALDLKEVIGENKWSAQIGENKAKIVAYSGKKVIKDEAVMKLVFVVKKNITTKSAWVKISNFEISDGNEETAVEGGTITISIQEKQTTPLGGNTGNQGGSTTTKPNTSNTNKKPNTSNQKPTTTDKPIEEKSDTSEGESTKMNLISDEEMANTALGIEDEMKNLMQSTKQQTAVEQKKGNKWFLIIGLAIIAIIAIAILGYSGRRK